ncbi:hypothetical protein ACFQKF_02120 [Halalkalicoccus sp. GCM10025322]
MIDCNRPPLAPYADRPLTFVSVITASHDEEGGRIFTGTVR